MSKLMTNPTPGTNKAAEDRLASSCDSQAAQLEDTPSPVDRVSGTGAAPHHRNRDGGGDASSTAKGANAQVGTESKDSQTRAHQTGAHQTAADRTGDWRAWATHWRTEIDQALDRYSALPPTSPPLLTEAMRYSLLAPGKRLRPLLVLAACHLYGGSERQAMPAACAVEMIHAYSLVHDDLPGMDNDDLRRGRPTCHIKFNHATAILVGDSLQSLAFQVLAETVAGGSGTPTCGLGSDASGPALEAGAAVRCIAALAAAAGPSGMAGGQQDDLMADQLPPTEASLERIHRRKTGALLSVSLEMGAIIAGADAGELEKIRTFGQNIGLAFQITDDLLDVIGDTHQVGKLTGKDQERGKLTYPALFGVDGSRRKAESLVQQAEAFLDAHGQQAEILRGIARFILERQQ